MIKKNKTLTLFDQFEKIVKKYLPKTFCLKYGSPTFATLNVYCMYKDQFKTKGVKALIGYVHYEETQGDIKYIAGTLGHDLNGIGDVWKTPRSSGYYKYYKSPAN